MLVANSFDLWQKDAFFSAAEEVQESADIMESAYRTWVRERRERPSLENLDELCRELQTALGTAKWQLEEFERAVRSSYGHRGDDHSTARHSQFIAAIESQISRVEAALRESFLEDGKQPLRWVNLDEEERDDLAAFLSGTSQVVQSAKDESVELRPSKKSTLEENLIKGKDAYLQPNTSSQRDSLDEIVCVKDELTMKNDVNYAMELEGNEMVESRNDIICQADRTANTRRTWSTPSFGTLKIVIADEDEDRNKLISEYESTPKEKGSKLVFWKKRCAEHSQANGAFNLLNQLFGRVSGSQRQLHNPPRIQYGCSVQVTLALMLTIFLIVPFLLYSN
ncbi:Syntaxin 6, N-terminal [Parasponia andersonii]|uniref:Syntaxin 6, N-terminal n=1 Tax=Parasponia andersonii TaxID=3476 RepID=A0A2P5DRN9_PARAD|nr:Syntaxin 6, N-terminal [Parasponia andersonii]